jgi:predicted nucleic acid-binding protein
MKLLDTTYLIDLLHNKEDALKKLDDFENEPALFIASVSVFELVVGIYKKYTINREKNVEELLTFLSSFEIFGLDLNSAIEAGKIHGNLIREGKEIDEGDTLIAGIALVNKVDTIITKNTSHFERIEGLKVESY